MTRSLPEWRGATNDTAIPARVKLRVLLKSDGKCAKCGRKVGVAIGNPFDVDHIVALANGGENAERNLQPLCVYPCHAAKSLVDVAEKAKVARVRAKHLGVKKARNPMPGSKASGWRKRMSGTVERRA